MAEVLFTGEIVAIVALALIATFLIVTLVRRRLIAGDTQPVLCALRLVDGRWRSGLLKLTSTTLEWFPLFGLMPRPRHVWRRTMIDIGETSPAESAEARGAVVGVSSPLQVAFVAEDPQGPALFDLALSLASYMALRSWLEAAPPMEWHSPV